MLGIEEEVTVYAAMVCMTRHQVDAGAVGLSDESLEAAQLQRSAVYAFKNGRPSVEVVKRSGMGVHAIADIVLRSLPEAASCLHVPVPRSTKTTGTSATSWPAMALCSRQSPSIGCDILQRIETVSKRSKGGRDMNAAQLAATINVVYPDLHLIRHIRLVDDVVTHGVTIRSCVIALRSAGYEGDVSAFAVGITPPGWETFFENGGKLQYQAVLSDRVTLVPRTGWDAAPALNAEAERIRRSRG